MVDVTPKVWCVCVCLCFEIAIEKGASGKAASEKRTRPSVYVYVCVRCVSSAFREKVISGGDRNSSGLFFFKELRGLSRVIAFVERSLIS